MNVSSYLPVTEERPWGAGRRRTELSVRLGRARSSPHERQSSRDRPAVLVVDLQRRMVDPEATLEHGLELTPDRVAVVAVVDEDVCRERGEAGGDLPDVQIVDVGDVPMRGERGADRLDAHPLR
jgi:hypothetical protein